MKRKEFLIRSGALGMGLLSLPHLTLSKYYAKPNYDFGLQLYTLRDILEKDPDEILLKVSNLGFQKLELYDYDNGNFFGVKLEDLAKMLKDKN
jgi:hypothetical protein